jgi:ADP-heptose:LPS heptosyltransferase
MLALAPRICVLSNTDDLGVMVARNLLIKLLRERYPTAYIAVMAERAIMGRVQEFHRKLSWVDGYVDIDSERVGPSLAAEEVRQRFAAGRFDIVVMNPNSKIPFWIPYLSGIPVRVGYSQQASNHRYLTHAVAVGGIYDWDVHWSMVLAEYAKALGLDNFRGVAAHVPFIRVPAPCDQSNQGLKVAVHVAGNAQWNRRWPLRNFEQLCRRLVVEEGASVVLLGTRDDTPENRRVAEGVPQSDTQATVRDMSGASIEDTVRMIAEADVFVGNDSGPMNIAVATGTPIVAICGAAPETFRPDVIDARHVALSGWDFCARRENRSNVCDRGCPVTYSREAEDYPRCLKTVSLDAVWAAVVSRIDWRRAS